MKRRFLSYNEKSPQEINKQMIPVSKHIITVAIVALFLQLAMLVGQVLEQKQSLKNIQPAFTFKSNPGFEITVDCK